MFREIYTPAKDEIGISRMRRAIQTKRALRIRFLLAGS